MSPLPPVVHEYVQGDEHGFEVHGPPPLSYTCTVVQQRTGRVASDGAQRLSVASSSSRVSLCGLRIA